MLNHKIELLALISTTLIFEEIFLKQRCGVANKAAHIKTIIKFVIQL